MANLPSISKPQHLPAMKKNILLILILSSPCLLGDLHTRTWTSADGDQTFTGDYISHTEDKVTVRKNGKIRTIPQSLLSQADITWLSTQNTKKQPPSDTTPAPDLGKIGEKIKGKLTLFNGKRYARYTMTKTPEYYLLYFSASW